MSSARTNSRSSSPRRRTRPSAMASTPLRPRSTSAMVTLLPRAATPLADGITPVEPAPMMAQTRPCVLIVADDPCAARDIRDALQREDGPDWNIQVAEGDERALALALAQPPQVALLDVSLPDLTSVAVYRRLRANPKTRATPMVFLTAATSLDLYQHGVDSGVLLRKPCALREVACLARALVAR